MKLSGKFAAKPRGFERSALVLNENGVQVAEVFTDREPGDQYQTAALFAAAPELLAAAREALACIEKHVPKHEFAPRDWLRTAIAAAEGR